MFGVDQQTHGLVELDPFDHRVCQNANVGIFAPSGGGKTFFTKVLARRYLLLTDNTDVIVIDRKHEYRPLCEAMGGQFLRVAPSSPHRINPFDLPPSDPTGEGSALLDHIQQVLGLLDVLLAEPGQRLSLTERAVLDRAIKETYELAGITQDLATQGNAPPTMASLQAVLDAEAEAELDTNRTIAGSLAERLGVFTSGSLAGGLLSGQTNVSLDSRLVVFGIEELPDHLWPFAMYLIAGCVWQQVRRRPDRQRLLVGRRGLVAPAASRRRPVSGEHCAPGTLLRSGPGVHHPGRQERPRRPARVRHRRERLHYSAPASERQESARHDPDAASGRRTVRAVTRGAAHAQLVAAGHGLLLVGPWRIHLHVIASTAEERVAMTAPRERQALAAAAAAEEEEEVGA